MALVMPSPLVMETEHVSKRPVLSALVLQVMLSWVAMKDTTSGLTKTGNAIETRRTHVGSLKSISKAH